MLTAVAGCSTTDCPLSNTVMQKCGFYAADGSRLTIADTLTITVRDSVILNRLTSGSSVSLPMSYSNDADTLVFHYWPKDRIAEVTDTVIVKKTNTPHFVSLDCARSMFHTITGISHSKRTPDSTFRYAIERVKIATPEVNYDEKENLQIFFTVHQ